MIVYLLLNTVNNKCYVGKHVGNSISTRWRADLSGGHSAHLESARKKYGWQVFRQEILNICSSQEEMNNLEQRLNLNSLSPVTKNNLKNLN